MVAPGIRHSAQCRRRRAAFDAQENLQNLPVPLEAEYTRQFKRAAETAVQDLEETTRVLGVGMLMVYVDDILLCTSTEQAERSVISAISAVVPTKAELYAIQHLTQEAVAFSHFVHRVLFGLGEIEEKEQVDIVLESDSSSALQLIGAVDLPRRSRHIDIKLTWLKERVSSNEVQLRHRAGTQNVADLFTKCLGTRDFLRHRAVLGFMQADMPLNELWLLAEAFHVSNQASGSNNPDYLMVEVCCTENSNLRLACERSNIMYVGITANMETKGIKQRVAHLVKMKRSQGFWIHVHVSTPCKTGSPLQHFRETEKLSSEEQQTWEQVMEATTHYLRLGDVGSFELPLYNNIWGGHLLFV
ncbi:Copia protein (Gag-int-pol protein) [Cleaved into: Copia VLP protein [Durusdinium trenchii]|uniref:Copia protein (Gag-int-pol protein) [Cleaved into: Copia VLP protein n=1 Tax=Durusdinium trenchii TaxID=1381693 RepID=A0ABP0SE76_9DINO